MQKCLLVLLLTSLLGCSAGGDRPQEETHDFGGTIEPTNGTGGAEGVAVLAEVRTAHHPGYDRIVLQFHPAVPSYRVEYLKRPVYGCGSGEEITIAGTELMQFRFSVAQAHDEEGKPTVPALPTSALQTVQTFRIVCDFEGELILLAGLRHKSHYRLLLLKNPARLVIDIQSS